MTAICKQNILTKHTSVAAVLDLCHCGIAE